MRLAAIDNRAYTVELDVAPILDAAGVPLARTGAPDLSRTPGRTRATVPDIRRKRGSGHVNSTRLRAAVLDHAIALAAEHLSAAYGTARVERVTDDPFDLAFTDDRGLEHHVVVKGTTGAGADVTYTTEEVRQLRSWMGVTDLVVVRDIVVNTDNEPYKASGGQLNHVPSYRVPAEDLQATGWIGRVPGWGRE